MMTNLIEDFFVETTEKLFSLTQYCKPFHKLLPTRAAKNRIIGSL
jgi:hypothetical protein